MRQALVLSLLTLMSIACATSTTGGGVVPGQARPSLVGAKVLLIPVPDGAERKDGPAEGSGAAMTTSIRDAIIAAGGAPLVAEVSSLEAAFNQAKRVDYEFVLKAVFTEWEDNATAWSGRPDTAALSAELYDADQATLISTATQREKGTSSTMRSRTPDRFLTAIATAVVAQLFD